MAHLFIVVVNDSFNRKNVNLSQIYYVLDFSFFMSQDDAYYHIHQNDPNASVQDLNDGLRYLGSPLYKVVRVQEDLDTIRLSTLKVAQEER